MNDQYENDEPQDWPKGSMTFEVKISNYQEDFFVREIADRLCEKVSRGSLDRIDKTANELIEGRLRGRMNAIITDVLEKGLTATVQPSDNFSNPKGEPISPAEFIAQGAEKYMSERVDREGKTPDPTAYSHMGKGHWTRMEWALAQVINKQFEDEMKKAVSEITKSIRLQMQEAAAAWMAKFQAETVTQIEGAKQLASRLR
jgi:hypothetical protein